MFIDGITDHFDRLARRDADVGKKLQEITDGTGEQRRIFPAIARLTGTQ